MRRSVSVLLTLVEDDAAMPELRGRIQLVATGEEYPFQTTVEMVHLLLTTLRDGDDLGATRRAAPQADDRQPLPRQTGSAPAIPDRDALVMEKGEPR